MEDELRTLNEAMVMKQRLAVLADVQASYLRELGDHGVESGTAEQLLLDWSRQAFSLTFRSLPDPVLELDLESLLGAAAPPAGAQPPRPGQDPSRVPPGEPWLQLVHEPDGSDAVTPDLDADDQDEHAA